MRITIVSRSWPSTERSGVSLAASLHAEILIDAGHVVSIIGGDTNVKHLTLRAASIYSVPSRGSGVWYSPATIDCELLKDVISCSAPDLVVVEAWQTAISDATVDVCYHLSVPILMISHGVSVHPFTSNVVDVVRSLSWSYYSLRSLPKRISRLSAITTLDIVSDSKRFYDRDIALGLNIPVIPLVNSPINFAENGLSFHQRKRQILVVGYFSAVKNQIRALEVFADLPASLEIRFIGSRYGKYYLKCLRKVEELNLGARVTFCQDDECDVANEIASSLIVLCVSITEALPVTLLEAMASGTPFVAAPVGAIPAMGAGVIASNKVDQQTAILSLAEDSEHWTRTSEIGRAAYLARYTQEHVRNNLLDAISIATGSKKLIK
jgi:glycosyltransferase involved in cell wall biosynthesis